MKKLVAILILAVAVSSPVASHAPPAVAAGRENVIIILSDDQRWDKITPEYTPQIWSELVNASTSTVHPDATSTYFQNSFVTNPLCCPSRTTILTGQYSHTTGVWSNDGPFGGFGAFNDKHTLAVDFQNQGYRTAMIGKYLNGYDAGHMTYVPPGWDRWFADNTGSYYNYGVTTNKGTRHFGIDRSDYSSRVLTDQAESFVANSGGQPFFMYFALNAPHGAAIPDARDVGRFAGEPDYTYTDRLHGKTSSALEAGYGVDRSVGELLATVPDNTIVLYMSDNGYMWQDDSIHGPLDGKMWPYNESIRVPMIFASLDGTITPVAGPNDIVANVDLRTSLLHAVGLVPLTSQEGLNWFSDGFSRDHLLIEHYPEPLYCGIRTKDFMYVRFQAGVGSNVYTEEMYDEVADPHEMTNLADDPAYDAQRLAFRAQAKAECDPAPPGYGWTG